MSAATTEVKFKVFIVSINELKRMAQNAPCRAVHTAIKLGTNHGTSMERNDVKQDTEP